MNEDQQENVSTPTHLDPPARYELFLIFAKILITVMFIFPLVHHSLYGNGKESEIVPNDLVEVLNETLTQRDEDITPNKTKEVRKIIVLPPSCPLPHIQTTLNQLCEDYIFNTSFCTPEDFENMEKHKIPVNSARHNTPSDPRANIVGFTTAGFLIVSLVATFLELYKAKKQSPTKAKAPLTRKCSLADLTIMKHQRKELSRRDSILEGHEEGRQSVNFKRAPPLQRSSSTPAEPISELSPFNFSRSFDSRRGSIPVTEPAPPRMNLDSRRSSILDRRTSIIDGKFMDRFDASGKRISVDITNSPERKHHTRLVHRH